MSISIVLITSEQHSKSQYTIETNFTSIYDIIISDVVNHVSLKEQYNNVIKNVSKNRVYQFYIVISLTCFDLGLVRVAKNCEVRGEGLANRLRPTLFKTNSVEGMKTFENKATIYFLVD